MKTERLFVAVAIAVVILLAAVPVLADAPDQTAAGQLEPGNTCAGCHTAVDDRPAGVLAWAGSMDREQIDPCPAAYQIHQEIYYTERLLLGLDRARANLPAWVDTGRLDTQIAATRQTYSRLLDAPVPSLNAFSTEAGQLRYRLGKSYTQLNQQADTVKRDIVLLVAGLVTLFLLISLGWGLRQTARFTAGGPGRFHPGVKAFAFLGLVFILFSLPIFRVWSAPVETTSAEAQARQTAIDTAARAATTADRALARAWMLARVGAARANANPQQAADMLTDALAAANEVQLNTPALWGQAQAAQEEAVGSPDFQEKAWLVSNRLMAANSRAWGLRLIAAEWASVNPAQAQKILREALAVANSSAGPYRELDVRTIAVTWAALDPVQGLAVTRQINDPALRAWAVSEIAELSGDSSLYPQAIDSARQVADPVSRARLLGEIALRSGDRSLFDEARQTLSGVTGVPLAYALSDLAARSGDAALVNQIDPAYPDARAAALYRLGQFEEAWASTAAISNPFDRARAQAAIAGAWGNIEAARQIADATLRDLALRDIAIAQKDTALAQSIESPYYRVEALTALGQVQLAWAEADNLRDTYPLRALAVAWANTNPQTALAVVDKMQRETDKAEALRVIAAATGERVTFERALNLALAARVSGNPLAPVEASLALAKTFAPIDPAKAEMAFDQASEAARQISSR